MATFMEEARTTMLLAKLREDETTCRYCGMEMWFVGVEDYEHFAHRHLTAYGESPCTSTDNLQDRKATIDHIIPRAKGGGDHWKNLTVMCSSCNAEKADLLPDQWLDLRDHLEKQTPGRSHLLYRFRKILNHYKRTGRI